LSIGKTVNKLRDFERILSRNLTASPYIFTSLWLPIRKTRHYTHSYNILRNKTCLLIAYGSSKNIVMTLFQRSSERNGTIFDVGGKT